MRNILEILADGNFISGEAIGKELNISRTAVWKKIDQLRSEGWQIESAAKKGYRLISGDSLDPILWQKDLNTRCVGQGINRYLASVGSTNTEVKQMALQGAPGGSLCLAECQTAGKGRLGRVWSSPSGAGLWVSVMIRPDLPPEQAPLITLATALAIRRAVKETTSLSPVIKWPNDVIVDGKKLCGILLEISAEPDKIEYVVIGTGLNIKPGAYPEDIADKAISIGDLEMPPLRRTILCHYLTALEDYLDQLYSQGFSGINSAYRDASCTIGHTVQVSGSVNFVGIAEDIDENGALLVRTEDGILHRVLSGDVSVRGVMGYV